MHALKHFEVAGKIGSTADNLKMVLQVKTMNIGYVSDFVKEAEAEGNKAALMSLYLCHESGRSSCRPLSGALDNIDQTEEVSITLPCMRKHREGTS